MLFQWIIIVREVNNDLCIERSNLMNIYGKGIPNAILVDGIEAFGLMPQIKYHNLYDIII